MGQTRYYLLPAHIREILARDPMYLQRKHDEEVAHFRMLTKADVWRPKP